MQTVRLAILFNAYIALYNISAVQTKHCKLYSLIPWTQAVTKFENKQVDSVLWISGKDNLTLHFKKCTTHVIQAFEKMAAEVMSVVTVKLVLNIAVIVKVAQ